MDYRLFDFSSDVGVEGQGEDAGEAFVGLARALAHVLTDGGAIRPEATHKVDLEGAPDVAGTAVAFLNELIYLFDTEQFLTASGALRIEADATGTYHVRGTLKGERYAETRHGAGRGVKAATYHDATHEVKKGRHRVAVILDL